MNVPQCRTAEADGGGDIEKRAFHKHHIRRVDGNVGACADGNAGIGGSEGRCALMPSPTIATGPYFCSCRTTASLPPGRTPATTSSTPASLPMASAVRWIIARQHHNADAHAAQLPDGLRAFRLNGVRHGNEAEQPAVFRKQQRRFAGLGKRIRLLLNFLRQ